jgi:hypothetical protein
MRPAAPPRSATRVIGWLLAERDKEALIGDLMEEYALGLASTSVHDVRAHAARWYWRQVGRSVPPLLWASMKRGDWLGTLGAALASYIVIATLVTASDIATSRLFAAHSLLHVLASFTAYVVVLMLGGYLAAWIRPRAAVPLALIVAVMSVVVLMRMGEAATFWYQVGLIITGPSASLTGGRLRS